MLGLLVSVDALPELTIAPGVLVFSRILNDQEVLTVANFNTTAAQTVWVILDSNLSAPGDAMRILYSNLVAPTAPMLLD
jgi:riboflavin biosynthesis pyrimidine reductase